MSLRVMTWAWSVQLPPTAKFVLMALADEANDEGLCFPSQRRLASKCSITDRTVRRMLVELEAKGYVRLEPRQRADGSQTSNGYRLSCGDPPDKLSAGVDTDVGGPRTHMPRGPDTYVRRPTTYPLSNSTPQHSEVGGTALHMGERGRHVTGGGWEFPERLSAGQIAAVLNVLAGVEERRGQALLDELAGQMNISVIRNPICYCAAPLERAEH